MSRASLNANATHCRDLIRKNDPDRFLLAELAPPDMRPALWALAAFHWEVARIPDLVSEPMLGAIRRQWWREAWGEIAQGRPRRHPVVEALTDAHSAYGFDLNLVEGILEGRDGEQDGPPADLAALVYQCERIDGSLAMLQASVLGDTPAATACHVGTAWGVIGSLRALPQSMRRGGHHLPEALLGSHSVRMDRLNPQRPPPGFAKVVDSVAQAAEVRLASTGRLSPMFRGYRQMALMYRDRLAKAGWNPFDPKVNARTAGRAWRLLRIKVGL